MIRRFRHAPVAAFALGLALAAPARADVIEVGHTQTDTTPSCPASPCQAVSRTTGFQVRMGEERDTFIVPQPGRIVAWTITLGTPDEQQTSFFEENLGGPARAGITVLRTDKRNFGRVVGRSGVRNLKPYFGTRVQFALDQSIPVEAGYRVALTVPTWAPALAVGLGADTSWRASRGKGDCEDTSAQTAQLQDNQLAQYFCLYRTARLTYTATLITNPKKTTTKSKKSARDSR